MGKDRSDNRRCFAARGSVSGFSEEWLHLRESVDTASRSRELAAKLASHFEGHSVVEFADLGCGTGANLRYTSLFFPPGIRQHWRLFDNDPRLLAGARQSLSRWASSVAQPNDSSLELTKDERDIRVTFSQVDLSTEIETILRPGEVATASAFFDLASAGWIARFAKAVAKTSSVVYAPLIYNGFEKRKPPHPGDGPMLAAFHVHQRLDKGLGAACGPAAASVLEEALSAEHYSIEQADSTWQLVAGEDGRRSPSDGTTSREQAETQQNLIEQLAEGSALAAAELKLFDQTAIRAWAESRMRAASCAIGHTDLLAIPPR
jgi:hypothetical protein